MRCMDSPSPLDAALERQGAFGPEYGDTLSSHVPMVLEALERIDRPDAIEPYLEAWLPRLRLLSTEADAELAHYPAILSEAAASVSALGPKAAVSTTFARWAPGLHGAAFHGLLRLAHAVRALDRADTPARRAELARGLAYAIARAGEPFAATFAPEADARPNLERAWSEIEPSPHALEARTGLITPNLLARIRAAGPLDRATSRVALPGDVHEAVRALRRASLALFVDGEHHPSATFVLLHGVTAVDAVSALVPWLDDAAAHALVRSMAASLFALRIAYVGEVKDVARVSDPSAVDPELVDRAVRSGDDHAIKLAAACLEGARSVDDARWNEALAVGVARFGRGRLLAEVQKMVPGMQKFSGAFP